MLVQPNKSMLGDTHLDPAENLLKLKEGNAKLVADRKLYKQDELEDQERSAGPRLAYQEVIRRLCKANTELKVVDGSEGNVALYVRKNREEREGEEDPYRTEFGNDHKYVGGFAKEPLPEYSTITVDERGLPKREVRGWRSVLITLIVSGVITYRNAVKYFGEANGQRAWRWHDQLQKYKE